MAGAGYEKARRHRCATAVTLTRTLHPVLVLSSGFSGPRVSACEPAERARPFLCKKRASECTQGIAYTIVRHTHTHALRGRAPDSLSTALALGRVAMGGSSLSSHKRQPRARVSRVYSRIIYFCRSLFFFIVPIVSAGSGLVSVFFIWTRILGSSAACALALPPAQAGQPPVRVTPHTTVCEQAGPKRGRESV